MAQLLTQRDEELLDALSCRVRLFTLRQVADTWWKGRSQATAQTRLRTLEKSGWVNAHIIMAHPLLPLSEAIFIWIPGKSFPPYRTLSYQLIHRWNQEPIRMRVFTATSQTGQQYGGRGGGLPRNIELSHDIHVAQVFLTKWKGQGMEPDLWESEELFHAQEKHDKRPDAFVRPNRAIEMGGQYSPDKLKAFHGMCEQNGWEYEIW